MKILLVAPANPDLPSISATVAAITRYHDVTPVTGNVRESDIQRAIEEGPVTAIWWVTHGGPEGVLISGGVVLSVEAIGQYVGASEAKLCVISTCDSEDVAIKIIAGGEADMVFTISPDIKDADALRFDSLYAAELSKTDDYEEAFQAAAGPGSTKYRYLRAKQALRGLAMQTADASEKMKDQIAGLREGQYKLEVDFGDLKRMVDRLTGQVQQNQQSATNAQAAAAQTADLDRNRADRQVPSRSSQPIFTPTFWLILVAIVLGAVFYLARMF